MAGAAAKIDAQTGIVTQELQPRHEINMLNAIYGTPTAANGVLYISNKDHLFAIAWEEPPKP